MIGAQVEIISPKGSSLKVPESAFRKVWAERGYRLASDVEAEKVTGSEEAAVGDQDPNLGTPPSAEEQAAAAKAAADAEAAALAAAGGTRPPVGETGAGDSNQTKNR